MRSIIRVPSKVQFAESNGSCWVLSCSYTECDVDWSEATQGGFIQGINTCIVKSKRLFHVIRIHINIRYGILMRNNLAVSTVYLWSPSTAIHGTAAAVHRRLGQQVGQKYKRERREDNTARCKPVS